MLFGMPTLIECATLEENLALCQTLGLDFIELNMNLPQYQTKPLRDNAENYKQILSDTGIFFTLHLDENLNFADFNPLIRQAYFETTVEAIEIAKTLKIPVINLHMPKGVYFTLPEKRVYLFEEYNAFFLDAVIQFRKMCEQEIGGADVKICIENTDGWQAFQQQAINSLLKSSCFGLTWDIGHSHAAGDVDEPFLLEHRSRLSHFHIHDALRKRNHLALGFGEIDLFGRLKTAKEQNCRCVIETKTAEALRQSVKYMRERMR